MDTTDQRLVTLLRHDGRRSLSDLAEELGLTRTTVRARLERAAYLADDRNLTAKFVAGQKILG